VCGPCPVLASYTLAFALQLRKKHGKIAGYDLKKKSIEPAGPTKAKVIPERPQKARNLHERY